MLADSFPLHDKLQTLIPSIYAGTIQTVDK
jgi:hypothetical protein